jgi:hypothetical protein
MTQRTLSLGHPGDRSHGVYPPIASGPARRAAGLKGFLDTLFDFGVFSLVTTMIIGMPIP